MKKSERVEIKKDKYRLMVEKVIYDILYEKSTVDGVRVIHEDVWPIEELVDLIMDKDAVMKRIYNKFTQPRGEV